MKIVNQTKNTVLADKAILACSLFARMKGLLGRKNFPKGQALIIRPGNSLHTFFMRFSIDAIFVHSSGKIIQAISGLAPFRLTKIYFPASYAIELPAGILKETSTEIGDAIQIT